MSDQEPEGFVTTEKAEDNSGTTTVIFTREGVGVYDCPGGLVEDELLD